MSLSETCIRRPVLAIVLNLGIILFGAIGFTFLGVREYPSIDPPVITVRTSYTGANADVIESQITEPLEKSINGIAGIRLISSASNQGSSNITVEFNLEIDLETAANDVRDKVSQALRQLPQDIDAPPVVTKADANSDAIISMTVQSDIRNILELSDFAENFIGERLQTIPGVSSVQIWGQKRYAMRIWMDPEKLSSYQLSPLDVRSALDRENVDAPSGKIYGDQTELSIRTKGRLTTEEEFNNLIISSTGQRTIRLKDIGYAILGPENEETVLKQSGQPMVGVALIPQPGSNYVEIAEEFYKRVDQLKKDVPSDYRLNLALDNTRFVKRSIKEVEETLLIAVALVVLIVFLFFRDWVVAIRPLIDIPVSLIGAFFIMYIADFSVNILTLLAIVLATGLVVDDGIVVTENIFKKIENGLSPMEAAFKGSREIFFAVISTSITLAAVFLPVIFLQGFVGRLFREFGVVIAGAVLISAFVSLTLTPMLSSRMFRKNKKHTRFYEMTEPFFVYMTDAYRRSLEKFISRKFISIGIVVAAIVLIFVVGAFLPSELAPLEDRSLIRLSVTAPEGASFDYTDRFLNEIVALVNDSIPEKRIFLTVTAPGFAGSGAPNTGFGRLVLTEPDQRNRSQQQIAGILGAKVRNYPDARTFILQEQTISAGGGGRGGLPIQFVIQAQSFDKLKDVLPKFLEEVSKDPTFQGFDANLKFNRPELQVSIDRNRARSLGISIADVAQTMRLALSGQRFGYFVMNGKQYQIIGQVAREFRDEPLDLKSLNVRTRDGQMVQLDNLVTVSEQSGPPQLYHYNRYQSATISAGIAPGKTMGEGIEAMRVIGKKILDDTFSTALAGPSRDYAESSSNILFAFFLALILIYLVLAAQFESFLDPFIIMLTVPLALAGAVLSLWYFNQSLNIFSQIGMIMLIGLVTKNGILIVEFANQLREKGNSLRDSILEGSTLRLRPIVMTTLSTILGALPIALALGAGAKSRIPMGIVVIGGLLFSLMLTLYVIPAIYALLKRDNPQVLAVNPKSAEHAVVTTEIS